MKYDNSKMNIIIMNILNNITSKDMIEENDLKDSKIRIIDDMFTKVGVNILLHN